MERSIQKHETKKNTVISIYLTEDELKKTEEARNYGVLNISGFFKVLIKNGLDEQEKLPKYQFTFEKDHKYKGAIYKTRVIRLDPYQYEQMEHICNTTPFTMSSLAKYFIMPRVYEIVERKEWSYKPWW